MNRRTALTSLAAATLPTVSLVADEPGTSEKKGWCGGDASYHKQFGAKWYYTWSPKTRPSKAASFVPMMKGEWSLKQIPAIQKMGGIDTLLGFNEPERVKQGNLSVKRAIELWPKLVALAEKKNLRLGSPAPSSDKGGLDWFEAFMSQAKSKKLRVDFVAMHWYRGTDADEFESFVKKLVRSHRMPIWITEFNGWSGPEEVNYEFLKDSLRFLEKNSDVERYAYFNPGKGRPHSLIKNDGSITRMGELYRSV